MKHQSRFLFPRMKPYYELLNIKKDWWNKWKWHLVVLLIFIYFLEKHKYLYKSHKQILFHFIHSTMNIEDDSLSSIALQNLSNPESNELSLLKRKFPITIISSLWEQVTYLFRTTDFYYCIVRLYIYIYDFWSKKINNEWFDLKCDDYMKEE